MSAHKSAGHGNYQRCSDLVAIGWSAEQQGMVTSAIFPMRHGCLLPSGRNGQKDGFVQCVVDGYLRHAEMALLLSYETLAYHDIRMAKSRSRWSAEKAAVLQTVLVRTRKAV